MLSQPLLDGLHETVKTTDFVIHLTESIDEFIGESIDDTHKVNQKRIFVRVIRDTANTLQTFVQTNLHRPSKHVVITGLANI